MNWISVKERLPECFNQHGKDYSSNFVLVYDVYKEVSITCLWNDKKWGEYDAFYEVTHWMPLPEPPKK